MAKKSASGSASERPKLLLSREDAKQKLQAQIDKGTELLSKTAGSQKEVDDIRNEYYRWDSYNGNLIRALFTTDEHSSTYSFNFGGFASDSSVRDQLNSLQEDIKFKIRRVQEVYDAVDLTELDSNVQLTGRKAIESNQAKSNEVFVVHGHDDAAKLEVARFLEKLKLKPVILNEQLNQGRTIIEKIEHHSDVAFAVVLLTPDDLGASKASYSVDKLLKPRARENVILELGYFYGKLKRSHVCALLKADTQGPSDISGVVYTQMDDHGGWHLKLAKEMKAAGLPVSLDDL